MKKIEIVLITLLILAAIFFRFWQIKDYALFLGDEGRDMIVMRQIFIEKKLPFLGPTASVASFYLGPVYYWMAAPFLFLSDFDPVGPSYFVAALGVATVLLLYTFLKQSVGFWPAILAASLYSLAPLIVRYSRSSWNPNPLPFFSLLLIYFIYLGITRKKTIYFFLAGSCFGIALQLHYLAVILVSIAALIITINTSFKKWPMIFLLSSIGFLVTFSPFLIFEAKHGFPNIKTILEFVTRGSTIGFQTPHLIWLISNIGNIFLEELSMLKGTILTKLTFWALTLGGLLGLLKNWKDNSKKLIYSIGIIWFLGGLIFLRFYTGQLHDYYFGFMFPAPFLLSGLVFHLLWPQAYLRLIAVVITIQVLAFFFLNGFYTSPPNRLIDQTETIADFIIEKSQNQPFNFAMISDHNSDHAYRYFLEIKNRVPTPLETLITDQLLIICESTPCPSPLGHPLWEIAAFGRGEISGEWDLPKYGFKVFRLTHWPGVPSPAGKPALKGI